MLGMILVMATALVIVFLACILKGAFKILKILGEILLVFVVMAIVATGCIPIYP